MAQANDTNNNNETGFFELPPELRNYIYELALGSKLGKCKLLHKTREAHGKVEVVMRYREPALLRVDKQMRYEAGRVWFGSGPTMQCDVTMVGGEVGMAMKWIRGVVRDCGNNPFRHLRLYLFTGLKGKVRLTDLSPLVALINETGIKVCLHGGKKKGGECGIWLMPCEGMGKGYKKFCRNAVELGETGKREGWSVMKLSEELDGLLKPYNDRGRAALQNYSAPGQVYWNIMK